jgi:tetratricopeptide (TPR) repeat protein
VAWASERKDVLSTFFGLLALLAYVHYVRSPRVVRYLLVVVGMALSLLAKPMLVTLPFVLCLFDYWPLGRWQPGQTTSEGAGAHRHSRLRWLLLEKVPLLILSVVFSITTIWAQQRGGSVSSLQAFSLSARIGNALISYAQYLWPADLALFYPLQLSGPSVSLAAISGLLIIAVTIAVIWWRRNYPYLLVGWLFFLGTLLPVIGLIQVGVQARADRYTYVPLIGVFTAASWGMADLATALDRRRLFSYLAGAIFFLLTLTSWTEAHYWYDSLTVWNHTLEVTENNYGAHVGRGFALLEQGEGQSAERDFREAQRLAPGLAESRYGLSLVFASRGAYPEAMQFFQEALAIRPEYPEAYNNLGVCLLRQNKREEAISCFQQALRLSPDWPRAQSNLRYALNAENRKSPE